MLFEAINHLNAANSRTASVESHWRGLSLLGYLTVDSTLLFVQLEKHTDSIIFSLLDLMLEVRHDPLAVKISGDRDKKILTQIAYYIAMLKVYFSKTSSICSARGRQ
jgi:hypothetical protein